MAATDEKTPAPLGEDEMWFDKSKNIDSEWAEVSVTTTTGRKVRYRIPRRTYFEDIDQKLATPH